MPKKRITGVKVVNKAIVLIEETAYKCVCIKNRLCDQPLHATFVLGTSTSSNESREFIKGKQYEYTIDSDMFVSNPYSVYLADTMDSYNYFTKEGFDEYFIDMIDNRNNIIDDIIK